METMDLEYYYEPETILEEAAFGVHCLLQKVSRLIMIRRRKSSLKDDYFSEEYQPCLTRQEWLYFLTKIKSFSREDCVPAIAEIKGITTKAADAEFTKMMGTATFVPRNDLEAAWQTAMNVMYDDILDLVRRHRQIRRDNLVEEENLDARKNQGMTDPEEAADGVEKLTLSETMLQNSQEITPREADDAVEKESRLTELELLKAEYDALDRLGVAKKRVDRLLPEAFYEW